MPTKRESNYPISPDILNRVSNRAMSGEIIDKEILMQLFEAARWAPSGNNNQLTRFIYASRDSEYWQGFFDLLATGNQSWCKNASTLVIILSRKNSFYHDNPQRSHSFEAGAAFENLAIEGVKNNLVVHPMGGFDIQGAKHMLELDDVWNIEIMVAVGKPGNIDQLDEEDQKSEQNPSQRKPLEEIVFEGKCPKK